MQTPAEARAQRPNHVPVLVESEGLLRKGRYLVGKDMPCYQFFGVLRLNARVLPTEGIFVLVQAADGGWQHFNSQLTIAELDARYGTHDGGVRLRFSKERVFG